MFIVSSLVSYCGFSCLNYIFTHFLLYNKQTAWYLLHVICNMIIIIMTFDDVIYSFTDMNKAFDKTLFNTSPSGITVGLHVFHIINDYKNLTIIDWLHHLISNWFMAFVGVYYNNYPTWNCGIFFMCGLPGGIDYLLLFLVKRGKIKKITEKNINVYLNNWIRNPCIIYTCSLNHSAYIQNIIYTPSYIYYISQFFILFNAIYFTQRVTLNYGSYKSYKSYREISD
jgi:hypothetical protein